VPVQDNKRVPCTKE